MERNHSEDVFIEPYYRVLCGSRMDIRRFEEKVNEAICRGYEPVGAPAVEGGVIYQAMRKGGSGCRG